MEWRETQRRLNDGSMIRTTPIIIGNTAPDGVHGKPIYLDGWLSVNVYAFNGSAMFMGTMRVDEAFTEIPFQLDRAREFTKQYEEARRSARGAPARDA